MSNLENPYGILGVSKDASLTEIRKQYLKKCKQYHPDKSSDKEGEEFIRIKAAYDRLTGKDKEVSIDELDWSSVWKLSMEDILKFEKEYKGSDEEKYHVLKAYTDFKGDIQSIIDNVLCATNEDEERFISFIQSELDSGKIEKFRKFTLDCSKTARRKRKMAAEKEAKEAEELSKELGLSQNHGTDHEGSSSLELMIKERAKSRFDAMIANIENKYVTPNKKSKFTHKSTLSEKGVSSKKK